MKFNRSEVLQWLEDKMREISDWHQTIFDFGETAWREYRSCAWYVKKLKQEGFQIEECSGGMPTAFCATWDNGDGPTIWSYAEYDAVYAHPKAVGAPQFNIGESLRIGQEIQKELGLKPSDRPFLAETEQLITPQQAETELRKQLPEWQEHFTSDDYTEYCWHAPTVRLYIARPTLASPEPGYQYPAWVMNALGGIPATINPMIETAAKTIACTMLELLSNRALLQSAKEEFIERTGGGKDGTKWQPPLCDYAAPINFRWPEYVNTERGYQWYIP